MCLSGDHLVHSDGELRRSLLSDMRKSHRWQTRYGERESIQCESILCERRRNVCVNVSLDVDHLEAIPFYPSLSCIK